MSTQSGWSSGPRDGSNGHSAGFGQSGGDPSPSESGGYRWSPVPEPGSSGGYQSKSGSGGHGRWSGTGERNALLKYPKFWVISTVAAVMIIGITIYVISANTSINDSVNTSLGKVLKKVQAIDLKPGDCTMSGDFLNPSSTGDLRIVDCKGRHDAEVFAEQKMPDGVFPGDDKLTAESESFCNGEVGNYLGTPAANTKYSLYYFFPTEQTWNSYGDRTITCIVYDPNKMHSGLLKVTKQ